MRLPALSVIIAVLAIVWCVAGSVVHSPWILLYPSVWGLIAAGFYLHYRMYPIQRPAGADVPARSPAEPSTDDDTSQQVEEKPQKLAAG